MKVLLASAAIVLLLVGASLASCGTPQAQTTSTTTPNVQTVTVTLTDSGVTASQTTFRPGVRCHFIVTNHGTRPYQFWLMWSNPRFVDGLPHAAPAVGVVTGCSYTAGATYPRAECRRCLF